MIFHMVNFLKVNLHIQWSTKDEHKKCTNLCLTAVLFNIGHNSSLTDLTKQNRNSFRRLQARLYPFEIHNWLRKESIL